MAIKIKPTELEIWLDPNHCLKAVENDGYALRYVVKDFWGLFKGMIDGWDDKAA